MAKHPSIFISYRIADSLTQAGRLHQSLETAFGEGSVFYDKHNLKGGDNWKEKILENLRNASVVLVVISNKTKWLGVDDDGIRRIDDPKDFMRQEVALALEEAEKKVIPVLLNEAKMPPEERLPEPLKSLFYLHHKQIREANWEDDLLPLLKVLEPHVQAEPVAPAQKMPEAGSSWGSFFEKHPLKLKKDEFGLIHTVNCDREEHYKDGLYQEFSNHQKKYLNLAFLLSACLYQKPASLAKRLLYDLEIKVTYPRNATNSDVEVADLNVGKTPEDSWVNFWTTVESKLRTQEPTPDPIVLAQGNMGASADRIAFVFRVAEQHWRSCAMLEVHIAFILAMFSNLPESSCKFLLFFVFEFKYVHRPDGLNNWCSQLEKIDALTKTLNQTCIGLRTAHYKLFPPVKQEPIEAWFESIALSPDKNSNRTLLDTLRNQLHPDDRARPDFDMEDVEKMQQAAYQYINRPQPDSIK